jgi:probable H4MPT-linked C1 transfer pathway protein
MNWLGLDIGGANLKAADGCGWAFSTPFALWRDPAGLAAALAALIQIAPAARRLAVTMTGEQCDCFRTQAEGVRHILTAVEQAAAGREIRVYLVDGRFVSATEVREQPHLAAASNWHALASFACRYVEGRAGLLVDVGSTTTDIVPLVAGRPAATGINDTERLVAGELVYTGVGRTPVCAVTRTLPWRDQQCPAAAELFATTADAYVLLGQVSEQPDADWTADSRPLTKEFARDRLARMICADASTFGAGDALRAAVWIRSAQVNELQGAIARVLARSGYPAVCVLSGSGEFLGRLAVHPLRSANFVSLSAEFGHAASASAAAQAVAVLAGEALARGSP